MIEEQFPPLEVHPVEFPLAAGIVASIPPERVLFGGPAVTAISSEYHPEDGDLHAFITGSHDRWALVHMAITFPPTEGSPVERAKVQVNLSDDGDPSNTIAFSLLPLSSGMPYEETNSYTVSPNVTAGGTGISLGSVGKSVIHKGTDTFLVGGPELSAAPAWSFRHTKAQELVGSSRLSMTVRAPRGRSAKISVHLEAEIAASRWTFWKIGRLPLVLLDPADVSF
jgi:hypothetical protein